MNQTKLMILKELHKRDALTGNAALVFDELVNRGEIDILDVKPHKLDPKIAEAKEFEQSTLGKGLDMASKVISAPARLLGVGKSIPLSERLIKEKQKDISQEERGLTKLERIKEDVKEIGQKNIEDTARFAPFVIPIGRGTRLGKLMKPKFGKKGEVAGQLLSQGLQTTAQVGAPRLIEELAKGEDLDTSVKTAINAGVGGGAVALALGGTAKTIPYLAKKLAPFSKKTFLQIQQQLTGIPADDINYALRKEMSPKSVSVFDEPYNKNEYKTIGNNIVKAKNRLIEIAKESVAEAKEPIQKKGITENIQKLQNKWEKLIDDASFKDELGKITSLDHEKFINEKLNDLNPVTQAKEQLFMKETAKGVSQLQKTKTKPKKIRTMQLGRLDTIKQDIWKYLKSQNVFSDKIDMKKNTNGVRILKIIANDISELIGKNKNVPRYKEANKLYHDAININSKLANKIPDKKIQNNLKELVLDNNTPETRELLHKLQTILNDFNIKNPSNKIENAKFINQIKHTNTRAGFSGTFPKNPARLMTALGFGGFYGAKALIAALLLTSPKIGGKFSVKGIGIASRHSKNLKKHLKTGKLAIPLIGQKLGDMESDDQQEEENKKLLRRKIKE